MQRFLTVSLLAFAAIVSNAACPAGAQPEPPHPYGALPSPRHLAWHELEFYGFLHFGLNTFTDREWGYGDESPELFNPSAFDADQIVGVAAEAGMKGLILTAKHHDGFCLWPSEQTEHDIAASPWREGRGDVVGEIAAACARHGLRFGVYLSPWDRNHPEYGRPEYVETYRAQLRELLTRYGDVFEVWWDGANGGDGYYGGARERRTIDRSRYYGWDETVAIVRELQPNAVIFSDAGDVRWVGNERGIAGDPCWATYTPRPIEGETMAVPGTTRYWEGEHGHRDGERWMPAECDVSIRPGWFYHESQDNSVKSPGELVDLYYASIGRGAGFLLNLPPDRRGLIHEQDAASLRGMRAILDATFAEDLARSAAVSASAGRGGDGTFAPGNVADGKPETYWATGDAETTPAIELRWINPVRFNVVSIREFLPLGQRVTAWALDVWDSDGWREIAAGEGIGARRLWRGEFQHTQRLRLRITDAPVCPAICEIGVFAEPPSVEIGADAEAFVGTTTVRLEANRPDAVVRYTLDGSTPTRDSPVYSRLIELNHSATVRAAAEIGGVLSPLQSSRAFRRYSADSLHKSLSFFRQPRQGVKARAYLGGWQTLDQLRDAEPTSASRVPSVSLDARPRQEHFALVFDAYIEVPEDGVYWFGLASDDGSRLRVHDALVVDNDGLHGMIERGGYIGLRRGLHPVRVEYFNATGGMGLSLRWRPPGAAEATEVPSGILFANE